MAVAWAVVALLIAGRFAMAFAVPLTGDEAYYWEWSRRLAFGYSDHPPAVAWTAALFSGLGAVRASSASASCCAAPLRRSPSARAPAWSPAIAARAQSPRSRSRSRR